MNNRPVLGEDGRDLWSQPALAASYHGLPYNVINGQTPQGIHRIDSVMPEANRYRAFGKYRRVILNWVPNAGDEDSLTKKTTIYLRTKMIRLWFCFNGGIDFHICLNDPPIFIFFFLYYFCIIVFLVLLSFYFKIVFALQFFEQQSSIKSSSLILRNNKWKKSTSTVNSTYF